MKLKLTTVAVLSSVAFCLLAPAALAEEYNQNITAIFGSGNPNTGWTTDTNAGITLALRAKNREDGTTTNLLGVYNEPVGLQQPNNNRARWNWEFSINSGTANLDAFDYYIAVDTDPTVGVSQQVVDALLHFSDNSYGTSATLNGQGLEGPSSTYAGVSTVAQQSQNLAFWGQIAYATINGTYDYELYAVAKGAGYAAEKLASTSITVVVGSGGSSVEQLIAALAVGATDHGSYVSAVNDLTKYLMAGDVINKKQRQELLTAAAKSSVGK